MAKQMDASTTSTPDGLDEIVRLLDEAAVRLGEAQRLVARLRGGEDGRSVLSSKGSLLESTRSERLRTGTGSSSKITAR